ncbi:MAG: hypothetical protein AB1750_12805 [Chloroflexota bacterium]
MNHLTDEQLNELLDVHRYTGTQVHRDTSKRAPLVPHPPSPDTRPSSPVTRHLDTCPDCRARLEELRAVFTALASLPEVQLSRDLAPSILAQIPASWGWMASRPTRAQKWIFAAQSLAALGIFAWLATSFILPPEITNYQLPTFDSLLASILLVLSSFSFEVDPSSFIFQPSSFDLESSLVVTFIVSAFLLWLVGNRLLLGAPIRESRK